MSGWSVILGVVAAQFLSPHGFAKDDKEQEAAVLEENAKQVMDFRLPGSPPFRLKEDVGVRTHEGKWVEGSYALIWAGPDRWREELTFPDYREVRVGGEQCYWRLRNRPSRTEVAVRAWSVVAPPKVPEFKSNRRIKRIYETRAGEITAKCVVAQPFQSQLVEDCFDADKGFLAHSGTKDSTGIASTELSDYLNLGGKFLPRQRRDFHKGKQIAEVKVREAFVLHEVDPADFSPPVGGVRIPHCDDHVAPKPISYPDPEYTTSARVNRITGTVVLDVEIGIQGQAEDVVLLEALDPGLDHSAVDTIKRKWRFEPATCSGAPVPAEIRVEVSFRQ